MSEWDVGLVGPSTGGRRAHRKHTTCRSSDPSEVTRRLLLSFFLSKPHCLINIIKIFGQNNKLQKLVFLFNQWNDYHPNFNSSLFLPIEFTAEN